MAAKAAPDGYTLYQNGFGLLLQGATKRVDFDVLKTFEPIARTTSQPYILLVHPSVPAKTIKELIAHSAAKPLTYAGSSGVGSTVHIGMERLADAVRFESEVRCVQGELARHPRVDGRRDQHGCHECDGRSRRDADRQSARRSRRWA